jgi:glyoxylase-like metal-dependent hydrolase (beta-lactamase superfamily II)
MTKESDQAQAVIKGMALGPFGTNTYVVGCNETKEGVVIDPGFEPEVILSVVEELELNVGIVLLTHGHVDHVSAVGPVASALEAKVIIHEDDVEIYRAAPKMALMFGITAAAPPEADRLLKEGDVVEVGKLKFKTLHTPGHSPGSVSFVMEEQNLVFSGDTLFARGIGRTDFPGGSFSEISNSIKTKLYTLDGSMQVLSGHGPPTTLREEMLMNPFVTL